MENRYVILITVLLVLAWLGSAGVVLYRVYTKDLHIKDKNEKDCKDHNATNKSNGSDCGYFDSKKKLCFAGTIQNGTCKVKNDIILRVFAVLAGVFLISAIVFPIVMIYKNKNAIQVSAVPQPGTIKFSYF